MIAHIGRGMFPVLVTIFLLALDYAYTAVGITFTSNSCHVRRFVELQNFEIPRNSKNLLVLIQLGAVHKDLIDLLACGIMKLL